MKSDAATAPAGISRLDLLLVSYLKQALRQPGCPLCRVIRDADLYYLKVFLREGKDDGRMLLRLLASWGLCARHADGLVHLEPVEHGDGLGTGTLYDWLLDYARRRLEDLRQSLQARDDPGTPRRRRISRRYFGRIISRLAQTAECPACEAQRQYTAYVTAEFARALEIAEALPEIRNMYLASEGLCLPHWRAMEQSLSSPDTRALVREKQRTMIASLKAALEAELACGVGEEVRLGSVGEAPAYARALATVAGATEWQRSAR